jgi:hypothetical protein
MIKLNFNEMSDFELIAAESQLEASIHIAITQMKVDEKFLEMEEELEQVKEEIKRRNIDL